MCRQPLLGAEPATRVVSATRSGLAGLGNDCRRPSRAVTGCLGLSRSRENQRLTGALSRRTLQGPLTGPTWILATTDGPEFYERQPPRGIREIAMGLAAHLGVDGLASPLMEAARRSWPRWCAADPELAVVEELAALREWTRHATAVEKSAVLAKLAALTAYDADVVTVLVWLLVPGATRIADDLRDLHPDIDSLVAGQLWIEAGEAHRLERCVSSTILRHVRSELCSEAGVGESAARRDRAWSMARRGLDLSQNAESEEPVPEPGPELVELFTAAQEQGAINGFDYWLLWALAAEADRQDAPARRGRMGLTTPGVVEAVADEAGLSPRSLRTRAARALDRLAAYAAARDDPLRFAEWKAQHRPRDLTARDEMELALIEDEWDHFVMERSGVPMKRLRVAFNVVLGTRRRRTA